MLAIRNVHGFRWGGLVLLATVAACGSDKPKSVKSADGGKCIATKSKPCADGDAGKAKADGGTKAHSSWAFMGRNPDSNYHNPDETKLSVKNAGDLQEKWRFTVAGFPAGSPVVAEGKVFAMATGGTYAIDFNDGTEIWERTDLTGTASAAYEKGFVYVHTTPGANLYKLKAEDGTTVWGPINTYAVAACDGTSSPIIADGKILVGHACGSAEVGMSTGGMSTKGALDDQMAARGGVEAFSTEDGSRVWSYSTVADDENGAMVWSTVAVDVDAGVVFATTGNNYTMGGDHSDSIHAIDLGTGERIWVTQVRQGDTWNFGGPATTGRDTDFGANPIVANIGDQKIVAAGDKDGAFWALDRGTGQTLWSRNDLSTSRTAANGGVLNNGGFDGKYFYLVSNQPPKEAVLHALDPANMGADVWDPQTLGAITWGPLSLANGLLFVPTGTTLNIHDASSGELLNSFDTGGTIAGGVAVVDGQIVVKSGLQYIFDSTVTFNNQVICYGL